MLSRQRSTDSVRPWRSDVLHGTLFLRADYKTHRFDRHFHEEFAIGIIESGCQAFTYDSNARRLDMGEGSVSLISPGIVHEGWPSTEQGWSYRMLYPSISTVDEAAVNIFGTPHVSFHRPVVHDPALYGTLLALHEAAEGDESTMELETLFLCAIRLALSSHAGKNESRHLADPSSMAKIRDLLEDVYDEDLTLSDLQNVAGLSKFHLLRQFKRSFGLPPHAYLLQVRVRRARDFIWKGMPLVDAAAMAGFADQAHMTRVFRKTFGFTPGAIAALRP